MALLNQYVITYGQIAPFFERIREGQAPEKFTRQHLKDIGFKSSNHHALIPLLKGLGFLTADGAPTQRYRDYLDKTRSREVLGQAVRENYNDLFNIKAEPTKGDKDVIAGKFKSTYNLSDNVAERTASTFLALLDLSDRDVVFGKKSKSVTPQLPETPLETTPLPKDEQSASNPGGNESARRGFDLCYNFEIHLPATKDIEVYNAIFRSMREQIIDR